VVELAAGRSSNRLVKLTIGHRPLLTPRPSPVPLRGCGVRSPSGYWRWGWWSEPRRCRPLRRWLRDRRRPQLLPHRPRRRRGRRRLRPGAAVTACRPSARGSPGFQWAPWSSSPVSPARASGDQHAA